MRAAHCAVRIAMVRALSVIGRGGIQSAVEGLEERLQLIVGHQTNLQPDHFLEWLTVALIARWFEGHVSGVGIWPRVREPVLAVVPCVPPSAYKSWWLVGIGKLLLWRDLV